MGSATQRPACDPNTREHKHGRSLEAGRRWAPPRGGRTFQREGTVAACQEPHPLLLLTAKQGSRGSPSCSVWVGGVVSLSLTHTPGESRSFFKALKPSSSSPGISVEKFQSITFPFSEAGSPDFLLRLTLAVIAALANASRSRRSVCAKRHG